MSITSQKYDNSKALIKIQGEFDNKNCFSFKEEVLQLISDNFQDISVDLKEMDFIDSPGIGILLSTMKTITQNGGKFKLYSPQMHILDIFEATQVSKFLEINEQEYKSGEIM